MWHLRKILEENFKIFTRNLFGRPPFLFFTLGGFRHFPHKNFPLFAYFPSTFNIRSTFICFQITFIHISMTKWEIFTANFFTSPICRSSYFLPHSDRYFPSSFSLFIFSFSCTCKVYQKSPFSRERGNVEIQIGGGGTVAKKESGEKSISVNLKIKFDFITERRKKFNVKDNKPIII